MGKTSVKQINEAWKLVFQQKRPKHENLKKCSVQMAHTFSTFSTPIPCSTSLISPKLVGRTIHHTNPLSKRLISADWLVKRARHTLPVCNPHLKQIRLVQALKQGELREVSRTLATHCWVLLLPEQYRYFLPVY